MMRRDVFYPFPGPGFPFFIAQVSGFATGRSFHEKYDQTPPNA